MKRKRPHTSGCRERMHLELQKTEEGRKWLEHANDRISEWIEEKHNAAEAAAAEATMGPGVTEGGGDQAGVPAASSKPTRDDGLSQD